MIDLDDVQFWQVLHTVLDRILGYKPIVKQASNSRVIFKPWTPTIKIQLVYHLRIKFIGMFYHNNSDYRGKGSLM